MSMGSHRDTLHTTVLLLLATACGTPDKVGDDPRPDTEDTEDTDLLVDFDGDGTPYIFDCDDDDPDRHPGSTEICNDIDDDCDGIVDGADALDAELLYRDGDQDGWGGRQSERRCWHPLWTRQAGDCDDGSSTVHPFRWEACGDDDGGARSRRRRGGPARMHHHSLEWGGSRCDDLGAAGTDVTPRAAAPMVPMVVGGCGENWSDRAEPRAH